jgi:hypothetical protein
MTITNRLIASSVFISCAAVGAGLAIIHFAPTMPFALTTVAALAGSALSAIGIGFVFGRQVDIELGTEPAELRHMASELASGYLNARHSDDKKEGAAGDLAHAIDILSEVFRRTKAATQTAIIAGHKIRGAAAGRHLGNAEQEARAKEIALWADELLAQAKALNEALAYYSFDPKTQFESKPDLALNAELPQPREAVEKPALRLLPLGEARPSRRALRGFEPKLFLLPRLKQATQA